MHHLSSKIIRENQIICIEKLNIQNMMKNHKLARNIQTQCWNSLFTKLKYKAQWHNRTLIRINQWYPSTITMQQLPIQKRRNNTKRKRMDMSRMSSPPRSRH